MKLNFFGYSLLGAFLLLSGTAYAGQCVKLADRTTPGGYVLNGAKCIGAMEQYGKMSGEDPNMWGSEKWQENAAFIDKTCDYKGKYSSSVAEEASLASTNFAGYLLSKNMVEAKAVLSGCDNLFSTFMK
jgi:hypothetical protein